MLQEQIRQIQKDIFAYNIETVPAQLSALMANMLESGCLEMGDISRLRRFNRIMQTSLEALQNQDYLLLADIVEYELRDILPGGGENI